MRGANEGLEWVERVWAAAKLMSQNSTCVRRQVGAVLVGLPHGWRLGYNREDRSLRCDKGECPRGTKTHEELPAYAAFRGEGECVATHAEAMVLSDLLQYGAFGCSLFVTDEPCQDCWRIIRGFEGMNVWVLGGGKYTIKEGRNEDLH